ncbi:hypothetical protein C5167_022056 [Papaver somniferum]|uniref:Uncharacterized protein n=1 Tax=Papaver somniferum TaxID=3469 RepID=A0A4Y7JJV8_PAPSO|nr:hypothetical protein C5167_022056 [Papaver somniferum]
MAKVPFPYQNEVIPTDGTRFVVDEKRGIILTDRHVAQTGPCFVDAEFSKGKLVLVLCIYVDPQMGFEKLASTLVFKN